MEILTPMHRDLILQEERNHLHCSATDGKGEEGGETERTSLVSTTSSTGHHPSIQDNSSAQTCRKEGRKDLTKQVHSNLRLSAIEFDRFKADKSANPHSPRSGYSVLAQVSNFRLLLREKHFLYLHVTRLKLRRLQIACFVHVLHFISSFLMAISLWHHCKQLRTHTTFTVCLLLLTTFTHPSVAQNEMQSQNPHSSSPFQPWIIADIDSSQELDSVKQSNLFRFPDFIIPANRLFQYQIPKEAFSLQVLHHYQVL